MSQENQDKEIQNKEVQIKESQNQENMQDNKLEEIMAGESFSVQKANWVLEEVESRRKVEDEIRLKLFEEQKLLEQRAKSIEDGMDRSVELRRYNEQRREELNAQVYAMYGLSGDKLTGMKEYKRALFKGCATILLLLSIALAAVVAYLYGITERLTIMMVACVAIEVALLPRDNSKMNFVNAICKFLYVLIFPLMMWLFVSYEFHFIEHDSIVFGSIIAVVVMSLLGALSYLVYDPYSEDHREVRAARKDLAGLNKLAGKQVRKNQKNRIKQEKKDEKLQKKETARQEREDKEIEKLKAIEEREEEARRQKEEKDKQKEEAKQIKKQERQEKWQGIKNRITRNNHSLAKEAAVICSEDESDKQVENQPDELIDEQLAAKSDEQKVEEFAGEEPLGPRKIENTGSKVG